MPIKLNVGAGRNIIQGWVNLDSASLPGIDIKFDLEKCGHEKIPLGDESVDEFMLSHVIEHIRQPLPLMEELYRLATPDAKCTIRVPYGSSDDAFEDPTHIRPYFQGSFGYFSQPFYWRADYGYRGDWQTDKITLLLQKAKFESKPKEEMIEAILHKRNVVVEMIASLRAVKPARAPQKELQVPANLEIALV